jgi:hypothetical protein
MRKVLLLTLLVFVFSSPGWAADISGNWALTHTGPMGEENWDLVITAEGNDLTITTQVQMFGEITGTGTLDGDKITMTFPTDMVTFEFKGTVEGDKMSGTKKVEMGGGGPPGGGPRGEGGPPESGGPPGGGGGRDFSDIPDTWTAVRK